MWTFISYLEIFKKCCLSENHNAEKKTKNLRVMFKLQSNQEFIILRPFLKWLGNKHRCLAEIKPLLPNNDKRLIEPFAGSGALFLSTDYDKYILGDQNQDLINMYKILTKEGLDFINYVKTFFITENNNEQSYYAFREEFNSTTNKRKKAALFIYLNRHGYNGLCRYNSSGGYNVPFGRYVKPYFPDSEMAFFSHKAQSVTFNMYDFKKNMQLAQSGDVVYCDPPYVALSKTANFTGYTKHPFDSKQQQLLTDLAEELANKNIYVIISNHDTEQSREYYKNATSLHSFDVSRTISSNTKTRKPVKELLAIFN